MNDKNAFEGKRTIGVALTTTIPSVISALLLSNMFGWVGTLLLSALAVALFLGLSWFIWHVGSRRPLKAIAIILMLVVLMILGIAFFKTRPVEENQNQDETTIIDQEETEEEETQEESVDDSNAGTVSQSGGTGSSGKYSTKPSASEALKATYSNVGGSASSANTGTTTTTTGSDTTDIVSGETNSYDDEIAQDVANGKDATELNDGVTAVVDNTPADNDTTDTKDESTKIDVSEDAEEVESSDSEEEVGDVIDTEDIVDDDLTDDELDELLEETGGTADSTDDESDDTTDNDTTDSDEETVVTPVSIVSVIDSTVYVGDTVQIQVNGDVQSIEGVTDYTLSSGWLSFNATEAGSLTVTIVGVDGSTDSITITVVDITSGNISSEDDTTDTTTDSDDEETTDTTTTTDSNTNSESEATDTTSTDTTTETTTYTSVSISPISGDSAYAGETVQFKVTGDVKSVDGLDGLSYDLSNGVLSIYTAEGETTVITVVINGMDGSSASYSVTVNALNFNN